MPDVYLSPSTQGYNPYIIGESEKYYMNLLADAMEPYLSSSGISYGRNDPNGNAAAAVARGNRGNYRLYLALHSNAAPVIYEGTHLNNTARAKTFEGSRGLSRACLPRQRAGRAVDSRQH